VNDPNNDRLLAHEVDGIREFDNALPRWWLYGFYFTIVFAVVYFTNYHVLSTPLVGRKTAAADYAAEMDEAAKAAALRPASAGGHKTALTDAASLAAGEAIFMGQRNLCHTCHRKDLGGLVGPNLTDDLWLHGCSVDEMVANVTSGFPPKGMLPFGSTQRLTDQELLQVVSFVISRHGSNPTNPKAIDPERDQNCVR
jgi:cytochrome c oxidase cbb3-type subunit 3